MEYFVPHIEPGNDFVYESPFIRIAHEAGEFILDHLNCRVRIFDATEYNHIELMLQDEQVIGVEATQELVDMLIENDFPYLYLPFVDILTKQWYDNCQVTKMNKELGEMGFSNE